MVYGGGASYAFRVMRWARAAGVPVIADVVEWYSPRQFRGGAVSPAFLSAHLALRMAYPRFDGVIAISEYLRHRYPALPTVVVPPTIGVAALDVARGVRPVQERSDAHTLSLCYFGSPGRKDLLPAIIDGFAMARSRFGPSPDLRLQVAGPDTNEVRGLLGGDIPTGVEVVGPLPQHEMGDFLRSADFSLLLRPDATYSRAGFPTKFVESLGYSTPVIANLTSDLDQYLLDGVTGFVVSGATATDLALAIERAMGLTLDERERMRGHARDMALRAFDSTAYVAEIDRLLMATAR